MAAGSATQAEYTKAKLLLESEQIALTQLEKTLMFTGGDIESKRTQVEIDSLRAEFNKNHLMKAPQAGVIIRTYTVNGQFVMQGTALLEIALPEVASFEIYVYPKDYNKVVLGDDIKIIFADGRECAAKVSGLSLLAQKRPLSLDTQMSTNQVVMPIKLTALENVGKLTYGEPFKVRLRTLF